MTARAWFEAQLPRWVDLPPIDPDGVYDAAHSDILYTDWATVFPTVTEYLGASDDDDIGEKWMAMMDDLSNVLKKWDIRVEKGLPIDSHMYFVRYIVLARLLRKARKRGTLAANHRFASLFEQLWFIYGTAVTTISTQNYLLREDELAKRRAEDAELKLVREERDKRRRLEFAPLPFVSDDSVLPAELYKEIARFLPLKAAVRIVMAMPHKEHFARNLDALLVAIYERDFRGPLDATAAALIPDDERLDFARFSRALVTALQASNALFTTPTTGEARCYWEAGRFLMSLVWEGVKAPMTARMTASGAATIEEFFAALPAAEFEKNMQLESIAKLHSVPAFLTRALYFDAAFFMVAVLTSREHDNVRSEWACPGPEGPRFFIQWLELEGPNPDNDKTKEVHIELDKTVPRVASLNALIVEANRRFRAARLNHDENWKRKDLAVTVFTELFAYILESVHPGLKGFLPVSTPYYLHRGTKTGRYRIAVTAERGHHLATLPPVANLATVSLRDGFRVALDYDPGLPTDINAAAAETSIVIAPGERVHRAHLKHDAPSHAREAYLKLL